MVTTAPKMHHSEEADIEKPLQIAGIRLRTQLYKFSRSVEREKKRKNVRDTHLSTKTREASKLTPASLNAPNLWRGQNNRHQNLTVAPNVTPFDGTRRWLDDESRWICKCHGSKRVETVTAVQQTVYWILAASKGWIKQLLVLFYECRRSLDGQSQVARHTPSRLLSASSE